MANWAWAYEPSKCDGDFCPHDCDRCEKSDFFVEDEEDEDELQEDDGRC